MAPNECYPDVYEELDVLAPFILKPMFFEKYGVQKHKQINGRIKCDIKKMRLFLKNVLNSVRCYGYDVMCFELYLFYSSKYNRGLFVCPPCYNRALTLRQYYKPLYVYCIHIHSTFHYHCFICGTVSNYPQRCDGDIRTVFHRDELFATYF